MIVRDTHKGKDRVLLTSNTILPNIYTFSSTQKNSSQKKKITNHTDKKCLRRGCDGIDNKTQAMGDKND